MNVTLTNPQKVVNYLGLDLVVPNRTTHLATNQSGNIYAHHCISDNVPEIYKDIWFVQSHEDSIMLVHVNLNGIDWKDTLQKV